MNGRTSSANLIVQSPPTYWAYIENSIPFLGSIVNRARSVLSTIPNYFGSLYAPNTDDEENLLTTPIKHYNTFDTEAETHHESESYYAWFKRNLNQMAIYGIALISIIPSAPYALVFFANLLPSELSLAKWLELSFSTQSLCVITMAAAMSLGIIARVRYFPALKEKLKIILSESMKSVFDCITHLISLALSGFAGFAGAGIGWSAFEFLGDAPALLSAMDFFILIFLFRIVFSKFFMDYIKNYFNDDYQFKMSCINQLRQLKNDDLVVFNELLNKVIDQSTSELGIDDFLLAKLLKKLHNKLFIKTPNVNQQFIFTSPTYFDQFKYGIRTIIDFGLGTLIGGAYFIFFGSNGLLGLEVLCRFFSKKFSMVSLSYYLQLTLAILSGFSSGILGFIAGFEFRDTIETLFRYMTEVSLSKVMIILIKLLPLGALCGLAATPQATAALVALQLPNPFGINSKMWLGLLVILGCTMLEYIFNFEAGIKMLVKQHFTPTLQGLIRLLKTLDHDSDILLNFKRHVEQSPRKIKNVSATLSSQQTKKVLEGVKIYGIFSPPRLENERTDAIRQGRALAFS